MVPIAPPEPLTVEQAERVAQAVILKAARFLVMAQAPLGVFGDAAEFAGAVVRPDYQIRELLYGLHATVATDVAEVAALVTADDVIRAGLGLEPVGFPTDRLPDVDRARIAAADWVAENVVRSWGVG